MRDRTERARMHAEDRRRLLERASEMLSTDDLAQHITEERRRGAVIGSAVVLAAFAVGLIALVTSLGSYPAIAAQLRLELHPGFWPYVVAVACFLPLTLRLRYPILALVLTSVFTGLYLAMPWPPAIVILAPMTALFTVAERYGGRRAIPIGIVLGAIVLGVSAMTVSVSYTVTQVVAIFALLGLAAALGHSARTRRELFAEVRQKREEEALRRVEEERLRIARDVHDIMAHSLTLMTLQADAGLTAADNPERSRAAFEVIGDTGRSTLRDLRSMLSVLAGGETDSPREPLADLTQLDALVASVRETGLEIELSTSGDFASVPSAVAVSAYRIVQEALTNVVRHAHARRATVDVAVADNELTLVVADDGTGGGTAVGTGSSADAPGATDAGMPGRGLQGMRERVDVLGGTITAGPEERGGFVVHARIPLTRSV